MRKLTKHNTDPEETNNINILKLSTFMDELYAPIRICLFDHESTPQ